MYSRGKKLDAKEIMLENMPYAQSGLFYLDVNVKNIDNLIMEGDKAKQLGNYVRKKIVAQDKRFESMNMCQANLVLSLSQEGSL